MCQLKSLEPVVKFPKHPVKGVKVNYLTKRTLKWIYVLTITSPHYVMAVGA